MSNDFCVLIPAPPIKPVKFPFLKIGNFDNVEEGDNIYTSGYPLGLSYQFVSRGILSTKFVDSTILYQRRTRPDIKVKRSTALLDLTINKGNSGGPIIKLGDSIDDDEVIGIANFLINPFGQNAEQLNLQLNNTGNLLLPTGISLTESMKLFSNAIIYSSNGISGCISINHFLQLTK
ncbi:MAG: trypsin-like peptidase domain-containing protein [Bacteroidetes bacterium]|nr:trypsin-like peptidase domain-containing protein [Bacteroidota bacterium]